MEGKIFTYEHHDGKMLAFIELTCQTDFGARTEMFKIFGTGLAMQLAARHQEDEDARLNLGALLESEWLFQSDVPCTTEERMRKLSDVLGEDIGIGKFNIIVLGE